MGWIGRALKTHFIPLPCHGRGTFHQPRLLQERQLGFLHPVFLSPQLWQKSSEEAENPQDKLCPRINYVPRGINPRLFPAGHPSTAPFSSPFGLPLGFQPESIPSCCRVIPAATFPSPGSSTLT